MLHDGKFYIKLGLPSGNAFPTIPAPTIADMFYREDENRPYTYDGAAWHGLAQLDVAETITADWTWGTDKKILFRDAAIYIHSAADGFLDLVADTAIRLHAATLYLTPAGFVAINDTANANMTQGLTINQGAYDNEILALKSSDVAHGFTDLAEADTFGVFKKGSSADGTLEIIGYRDTGSSGLLLVGRAPTDNTAKSTAGRGYVQTQSQKLSGATVGAVGADGNLFVIINHTLARFIFDAEGSGHADVEWVAFQEYDDLALIADMEQELLLRESEAQTSRRHALEEVGIIGKDSWHMENGKPRAMINFTKLSMLHHGALIQVAAKLAAYEQALITLGIQPEILIPI